MQLTEEPRRCADPDCTTVLSKSNLDRLCFAHQTQKSDALYVASTGGSQSAGIQAKRNCAECKRQFSGDLKYDTCRPCRIAKRQEEKVQEEYKKKNFRNLIQPRSGPIIENPTPEEFIAIIADAYEADIQKITNKKLCSYENLWARQVVAYLACEDLGLLFSEIALDFKTVAQAAENAYEVVADYVRQDQKVAETINEIRTRYVLTNQEAAVSP